MPNKKFLTLIFFILISARIVVAQPFLDLVSMQHSTFKNSGITNDKTNATAEGSWDLALLNIPLKPDSFNVILVSPAFEYRSVINDENIHDAFYRTAYLPVTWIHSFKGTRYKASLTGIYRFNADTRADFNSNNDQIGIAGIVYRKQNERLTYKLGLYFNQEFFYNQYIPFLGVDYRFSKRLIVTSLLPRFLMLDYTLHPALHTGITFRGLDESYRLKSNTPTDYFRVKEGYLRAYLDYYIPHSMLVATVGVGHTLSREYSYGYDGGEYHTFPEGAFMIHAGIALRFVNDPNFLTKREL